MPSLQVDLFYAFKLVQQERQTNVCVSVNKTRSVMSVEFYLSDECWDCNKYQLLVNIVPPKAVAAEVRLRDVRSTRMRPTMRLE